MTQFSGNLKSLNQSTPYVEPEDQKRARLIVERSQGARPGASNLDVDTIERQRYLQRASGDLPGLTGYHNLPTRADGTSAALVR